VRIEVVEAFFVFVTVTDEDFAWRHFVHSLHSSKLVPNPLNIFTEHLLPATIIEFGRAAICMAGDPLRQLKIAAILEKIRDPGCRERMV
jgi:hypothetical protein